MKVIVTGGAGFIGSNLVRLLLERGHEVLNIDALTYAGNIHSLDGSADSPAYRFLHADVRDASLMRRTLREYAPDWVMHLAAESHVDRSIDDPGNFMTTNVMGTFSMLQAALEYYRSLEGEKKERFRFHHISTDEVYGSLGKEGLFTESTPYRPHSPYSASKASSDHLVRAWHDTYGLPVLITNCSNNYGPNHFPISAGEYASPMNKGAFVNKLDYVILASLEVDTHFNCNVVVGSDGIITGAQGGHPDTAQGAKCTIVIAPLLQGRIPAICTDVTTVTTPGESVDIVVTDYGVAVNPRRPDLLEALKAADCVPLKTIEELRDIAYSIVGEPEKVQFGDRIVGIIEARDGTVMDVVREVKPFSFRED